MDSTHLFWDHVDHFYIIWLSFVLFSLMTHIYRRNGSALGVSDSSIINVIKQKNKLHKYWFQKNIVELNYGFGISTTC